MGALLRSNIPASDLAAWTVGAPLSADGYPIADMLPPEFDPVSLRMFLRLPRLPHRDAVLSTLRNPKRFDPNERPLPGEAPPVAPKAIPLVITPIANYVPELGGSNMSARDVLVKRAARQIVNMMEVWR